jgi:hypothetical protein
MVTVLLANGVALLPLHGVLGNEKKKKTANKKTAIPCERAHADGDPAQALSRKSTSNLNLALTYLSLTPTLA